MADIRPQSASMSEVLLALKTLINTALYEDEEGYVFIGRVLGSVPAYVAEKFVCITPNGVETTTYTDAGIWALPMRRVISISLCTRLSIDIAGQLEYAFTDAEYGHFYFEEAIINAVQLVNLRNEDDTANLLYEPMHVISSNPRYEIDENEPSKNMLVTVIDVEVCYLFKTERAV